MLSSWPNALLELPSSGSWEPTRPWAAVLLLLPLFLLLFSLRRLEQRTVLLGTARFFSGLSEGGGRSSSRRLTASRVLASLALLAATGAATARRGEHCRWSITSSTELAHAVISVQKSSRPQKSASIGTRRARRRRDGGAPTNAHVAPTAAK